MNGFQWSGAVFVILLGLLWIWAVGTSRVSVDRRVDSYVFGGLLILWVLSALAALVTWFVGFLQLGISQGGWKGAVVIATSLLGLAVSFAAFAASFFGSRRNQ